MTHKIDGLEPGKATPENGAGGCNVEAATTMANTKNATTIIAIYAALAVATTRLATWISVLFRGVV
jgi:hypothetical protein